jgi:hypothetical protein
MLGPSPNPVNLLVQRNDPRSARFFTPLGGLPSWDGGARFPECSSARPQLGCHSVRARLGWLARNPLPIHGTQPYETVWGETTSMPESNFYRRAMSAERWHDAIRKRAREICLRSGRIPGRDLENWAQAESEIGLEMEKAPHRRRHRGEWGSVRGGIRPKWVRRLLTRRVSIRRRAVDSF